MCSIEKIKSCTGLSNVTGRMSGSNNAMMRFLCFRCMRLHGERLQDIATMFQVTHASVIYGIQTADNQDGTGFIDYVKSKHKCFGDDENSKIKYSDI